MFRSICQPGRKAQFELEKNLLPAAARILQSGLARVKTRWVHPFIGEDVARWLTPVEEPFGREKF